MFSTRQNEKLKKLEELNTELQNKLIKYNHIVAPIIAAKKELAASKHKKDSAEEIKRIKDKLTLCEKNTDTSQILKDEIEQLRQIIATLKSALDGKPTGIDSPSFKVKK